jgi:hypothetical protein
LDLVWLAEVVGLGLVLVHAGGCECLVVVAGNGEVNLDVPPVVAAEQTDKLRFRERKGGFRLV